MKHILFCKDVFSSWGIFFNLSVSSSGIPFSFTSTLILNSLNKTQYGKQLLPEFSCFGVISYCGAVLWISNFFSRSVISYWCGAVLSNFFLHWTNPAGHQLLRSWGMWLDLASLSSSCMKRTSVISSYCRSTWCGCLPPA